MRFPDSLKLDYFQISLACLRRIAFRWAEGYAQFPATASSLLIIWRSDKFIQIIQISNMSCLIKYGLLRLSIILWRIFICPGLSKFPCYVLCNSKIYDPIGAKFPCILILDISFNTFIMKLVSQLRRCNQKLKVVVYSISVNLWIKNGYI